MLSSPAIEELTDADLTQLAADGDRVAAGELLIRRMPMLAAMARRVTVPSIDADDLLAEAITHLIGRWAAGDGPREGVDAYVIRSMRNRIVDELRSPRSRTTPVEVLPEPEVPESNEFHRVELHRELTLVQTALDRLPVDQRRVLEATVVDGRKPGDLVDELGRPAGAVYALQHRAKRGLQRSLLQTILEQSDEPACLKCAHELPKTITPDLVDDPSTSSAIHLRDCEHCSKGWERYLLLVSIGGAACLALVATLVAVPVAPAAAATGAVAAGSGAHLVSVPRGARSGARLAAGVTTSVVGVALVTWGAIAVFGSPVPKPAMTMTVTSPATGSTDVTVAFSVDRTPWTIDDVTLVLPPGETLVSAPSGWDCRSKDPVTITCTVAGTDPRGGTMSFVGTGTGDATYQLVIHATSGRTPITGTATGTFPR